MGRRFGPPKNVGVVHPTLSFVSVFSNLLDMPPFFSVLSDAEELRRSTPDDAVRVHRQPVALEQRRRLPERRSQVHLHIT